MFVVDDVVGSVLGNMSVGIGDIKVSFEFLFVIMLALSSSFLSLCGIVIGGKHMWPLKLIDVGLSNFVIFVILPKLFSLLSVCDGDFSRVHVSYLGIPLIL